MGLPGPPGPHGKKDLCCRMLIEHSTKLVPPALVGSTDVSKTLSAEIVKICDEVVIICGQLKIRIDYQAVMDGKIVSKYVVDKAPFTCMIDRDDIRASDHYKISFLNIICEVLGDEANFSTDKTTGEKVAFQYVEKEVIKVCIKKIKK